MPEEAAPAPQPISIHALREEGDQSFAGAEEARRDFYPRPPRGGRLLGGCDGVYYHAISIHALREEGDASLHYTPYDL